MRNNFLNLVAKMPQNTGGGTSRTKNRSVTVNLSSDTTTNREMTERRPREDRETFGLRSSLLGTLKYVACLLLALVLGVGNMWAQTFRYYIAISNADATGCSSGAAVRVFKTSDDEHFINVSDQFTLNSEYSTSSAGSVYYRSDTKAYSSSSDNAIFRAPRYTKNKTFTINWANSNLSFNKITFKGFGASSKDHVLTIKNSSSDAGNTVTLAKGTTINSYDCTKDFSQANGITIVGSNDDNGYAITILHAVDHAEISSVNSEMVNSESQQLVGFPEGGTWSITSGPGSVTAAGVLSASGNGTIVVKYAKDGYGYDEKSITVTDSRSIYWFAAGQTDATTNSVVNNSTYFTFGTTSTSGQSGNVTLDKEYTLTKRLNTETTQCTFTIPAGTEGTLYMAAISSGDGDRTLTIKEQDAASGEEFGKTVNNKTAWSAISKSGIAAGTYTITSDGNARLGMLFMVLSKATPVVYHHVTYVLGTGATGTTPTQADVAEGAKFTLHDGTTDITAPLGQKFDGWHDGTTKYAGGADYTMGGDDVELTAQWVENVPDPTATFANASYIIGASALDMSAKFTSNSTGSVTYSLKEATINATITSAGAFTATAAGEYVVVASQAAVTGSYAAISKEATVTVLDNELSDIYIWQKNSSNGGDGKCVTGDQANQNINANAASTTLNYTTLTMDGMSAMGRPAAAGDVKLTFAVRNAYNSIFGITSVCAYGKIEEPGGIEYSWNDVDWAAVAGGESGNNKHEFVAPSGTFPENFYIRFTNAETDKAGLWLRNALVTLQVKKTVTGTVEELTNVKVNGVAINATDLATLKTNKSFNITTEYALAPTITFVKQVTTSYSGGWADDVTSEEIDVLASEVAGKWQASQTINSQAYTVTLTKPSEPSLLTEATGLTLTSAKIAKDTESFTFSGVNLGTTDVTISLENAVAGMTVSPAVVTPEAGAITDQEVTVTYKSLEDVAEANVNLVVYYDETTKLTIPLTYSSTAGIEALAPISAATTWNWNGANSGEISSIDAENIVVLANVDGWAEGFNANAIAGRLQYYYRGNKYAQGHSLKFNTTVPGKVFVSYSNTGDRSETDPYRAARITDANGTYAPTIEAGGSKNTTAKSYSHLVAAGDVLIEGYEMKEPVVLNMLRFYEVRFAPIFAVTYAAGDGAVKSGETMPTQADEAAGEKIILAAATVLEKDGYDFAGWLCDIDGQTYQPGDEYEMTAAATTFTAQWVLHVDPVDPTLTYNEGAYMVGASALDLSTLVSASNSTGAITYSVKDAGTTGATITDGKFTATAAGTAIITASQAAILGYNAYTVDFNVVVTVATEVDGIKLVEAGALTGNFRTSASFQDEAKTIEGIAYTKYVKLSSRSSWGSQPAGPDAYLLQYTLNKKNARFYYYAFNTNGSDQNVKVYIKEEGKSTVTKDVKVTKNSGELVYIDIEVEKNAEVWSSVSNTALHIFQAVVVESGDALLKGGENGYEHDFNKGRLSAKAATVTTLDNIEYKLSADYKIDNATVAKIETFGTHYVKFTLNSTLDVAITTGNSGTYYIGTTLDTEDDNSKLNETTPTKNVATNITLAAGTYYISPKAGEVQLTKIAFTAPKCEEPTVADMANSELCEGAPYEELAVSASVTDGGTLHYQWYKVGDPDDEAVGTDAAYYTPSAEGQYYVVVTNTLTDHSDNSKKSNTITVSHFASAEITTAPLNQRGVKDATVMLTVAATGKNVAYKWYTCNEDGTNEVALDPAQTGTSLEVTITEGMSQWYKVKVTSDCGNAEAKAKVEQFVPATPANVTESIIWDWESSAWPASGQVAFTDQVEDGTDLTPAYELLADADAIVPNNAAFRSDMLYGKGQWVWRSGNKFFQGTAIKFTTEVAGLVRVNYRSTGNNKEVQVTIAGTPAGKNKTSNFQWTEYVEVPAGDVEILCLSTDEQKSLTRVQKIEFLAVGHERAGLVVGDLGTVCLPNASIARGVTVYEYQGADEIGKIVFDELGANELLEAGKPYIFQVKEANARFFYTTDAAVGSPDNSKALKGNLGDAITFQPGSTEAAHVYFVKDHAFWMAKNTGVKIGQYRCYLQMDEVQPVSSPNPAPGRRRIVLGVQGEQVATGIDELNASEAPVKVMIDGQLFIIRGEKMYNANGQLVK